MYDSPMNKTFTAISSALALTLTLGGCTAISAPEPPPIAACPSITSEDLEVLGTDVLPTIEVTDDLGTYCGITANPEADYYLYDEEVVDQDIHTRLGVSQENLLLTQQRAAEYIVAYGLDSDILDHNQPLALEENVEWFDATVSGLYSEVWLDTFRTQIGENGLTTTGITISYPFPEGLRRDGNPRAHTVDIELTEVTIQNVDQQAEQIVFNFDVTNTYLVSNAELLDIYLNWVDEATEEAFWEANPELAADKEGSSFVYFQAEMLLGYQIDNLEKISGTYFGWDIRTQSDFSIYGAED